MLYIYYLIITLHHHLIPLSICTSSNDTTPSGIPRVFPWCFCKADFGWRLVIVNITYHVAFGPSLESLVTSKLIFNRLIIHVNLNIQLVLFHSGPPKKKAKSKSLWEKKPWAFTASSCGHSSWKAMIRTFFMTSRQLVQLILRTSMDHLMVPSFFHRGYLLSSQRA